MTAVPPPEPGISQPLRRREDARLITGAGKYADDVNVPGQAQAAFVRSDHAHGIIRRIDATDALRMPGVLGVLTGEDLVRAGIGHIPYLPMPGFAMQAPVPSPRPALAQARVRHVGEPIAAVIAETLAQARDAAERVMVEIEPLAAVSDLASAVAPGAPAVWPDAPDNIALTWHSGDPAALDATFARAAHITRLRLVNNRVLANPIEPRASVASYDAATGRYSLQAASQGVQFFLRVLCEHTFNVPREAMHVRTYDVGGAFGVKEQPYPEDVAILAAARALGRPVKWSGTRSEHFLSDNHARDAVIDCALALDVEANFLAIRATLLDGVGAYCSCHAAHISIRNTTNGLPLVYKTPLVHTTIKLVMTNTTPVGPYRGAGREQAAYIVERLVDQAARELAIDPVALRRRNLLPAAAIPYRSPTGRLYDSGDFPAVLDKALALADWHGFDARAAASAKAGRLRGRGIASFLECVGGLPYEGAHLRFGDDGALAVVLATQSSGQSHETTFAQVVAHKLGLPIDRIRIIEGDSADVPKGLASIASRSMIMAGSAIALTCDLVIEKGRRLAAHMLEAAAADVEFSRGEFRVRGTDLGIALPELARRARLLDPRPPGLPESLDSTGEFTVNDLHFPNGCHICEIEIDPETGRTAVDRYCAVDDVGTVINPLVVHGQVHGGVAQGLGQTLLEHIRYDQAGQLVTASFTDYALPRAADVPPLAVDFHQVPATANPLGVKGCGEIGVTGSIAAISNAVADALARAGVAETVDLPATPEKIWRALRARD